MGVQLRNLKNNKLIKNFFVLLTGEGVSSILGMLAVILIVKAIGHEGNGKILSIQTYCLLLTNIFAFKSFQALIKYISKGLENDDYSAIEGYIKQSYILDIIAAVVTMIISLIFIQVYARFMKWDNELIKYSYIFTIGIIFQIQGTPIGILRIFDKFNYITYNNMTISFLRCIFYVIGLIFKLKLEFYLYTELMLYIIPNLILNYLAYKVLKENKLEKFYLKKICWDKNFFKFNFYSNIASTIDIPVGTFTTIIINKYLGYADISVYKIFEKIAAIIGKIGSPISQIIYPELTDKIAKKEYKKAKQMSDKLLIAIGGGGAIITIIAYMTHELWLWALVPNYKDYIGALVLYLLFTVFINATVGIHSLFLALNYIKYTIPILLGVNVVYMIAMISLITKVGLLGVIICLFFQAFIVICIKIYIMRKNSYKERNEV